jgi:LysM repeat protein
MPSRSHARSHGGSPRAPAEAAPQRRSGAQDRLGNDALQARRAPRAAEGPEAQALDHAERTGRPTQLPFRAQLEASFGADLSAVRAWIDADVEESMGAQAVASGTDVFFAAAPDLETAAHEVAHVLQGQRGAAGSGTSAPGDRSETAAAEAGARAARGEAVSVQAGADGKSAHRDVDPGARRSGSVKELKLSKGTTYTVAAADLGGDTLTNIARANGLTASAIAAFNPGVKPVAGTKLYLPSSDEVLLQQCVQRAGGYQAGVNLYGTVAKGANDEILRSARSRASGEVGEGYGTAGVDGSFFTPNKDLAGASAKRSEVVNGQREYRVNWGGDFWKCSVFMNDVVHQAGWRSDMSDNDHYRLAGQVHTSDEYEEVHIRNAAPGHLFQKFGGTKSNESHNAVLSTFVDVKAAGAGLETWTFSILGAETGRAADSARTYTVKKGTNETVDGLKLRFFEPSRKRK